MPLRTKYRTFAVKTEVTSGTPESLAAADGAENFHGIENSTEVDMHEREAQGTFSPITMIAGSAYGKASVGTHIYNSGSSSAPFWMTTLLPAAGVAQVGTTSTWKPSIALPSTLTMGDYVDGMLWQLAGALLDLTITGEKVGAPLVCKWDAMGIFTPPTDTAIITPTYPTVTPPSWKGATITLGSISPFIVSKMQIKVGNELVLRESAASTYGYAPIIIGGRKPRISLTVEVPTVAQHEYYADLFAHTTAAFSSALGSGSNNVITIAAPKLQLAAAPRRVKVGNPALVEGYELEYVPIRNSSGGDDEFSITRS